MSDLAAAAAAMGIPESLVQRSAEARAAETGASVEEILAAWAGGASAPSGTEPTPAADAPAPAAEETPAEAPADDTAPPPAPEVIVEVPAVAEQEVVIAAQPGKPPVLVGASDNPLAVLVGAVGLFMLVLLVGFIGPSVPTEIPGARSSNIQHTAAGEAGMTLFSSAGCAACHTQMVRPVVADVGLGAVTLNDANQPLGTRRFGPDLSDVGARLSGSQIEAVIRGFEGHPSLSLSGDDMNALVTYLLESNTSDGAG